MWIAGLEGAASRGPPDAAPEPRFWSPILPRLGEPSDSNAKLSYLCRSEKKK